MNTILVPLDFSTDSERALACAIDLAKRFGAAIHLLHSYRLNPFAINPETIEAPEDLEREVREAATARLAKAADEVSGQGLAVETTLTAHFPSEAICEHAEEAGIDLIVMGTRGLSGLKHVLLGSVAERTLRMAPCPVLTVKQTPAG